MIWQCRECELTLGESAVEPAWICDNGHRNNFPAAVPVARLLALVPSLTEAGLTDYDFGLAPLHKNVEAVWQGDQTRIGYYAEPACETLVIRREFAISYPDNPPRVEVTETISWYADDDSTAATKTLFRVYAGQRWLDWLEGKRKQIIEWLRWNVAAMMIGNLMATGPFEGDTGTISDLSGVMTEGGHFFGSYGAQISAYVGGYAQAFPQAVAEDQSRAWLDLPWLGEEGQTIRGKFAEQLIYS